MEQQQPLQPMNAGDVVGQGATVSGAIVITQLVDGHVLVSWNGLNWPELLAYLEIAKQDVLKAIEEGRFGYEGD